MSFFKHVKSIVETDNIGKDTRIWAFAHIKEGAKIGENCNICNNVFIEDNVEIGNNVKIKNGVSVWDNIVIEDDVFIGPNAVFTNDINPRSFRKKDPSEFKKTLIKRGATIGANATIVCGNTVGEYAFVGAGSVVTKDVCHYGLVYGNPAKLHGYICKCGTKLTSELICPDCQTDYSEIITNLE
jgi:acetyltransferase-like isoleucine patch superfamily enzyme